MDLFDDPLFFGELKGRIILRFNPEKEKERLGLCFLLDGGRALIIPFVPMPAIGTARFNS